MGELNSPMSSRPFNEEGRGGNHAGMKDGVAMPAKGSDVVNTPMSSSPVPSATMSPSTAGGPVGMQVTEDVKGAASKHNVFPSGTSSKVSGG